MKRMAAHPSNVLDLMARLTQFKWQHESCARERAQRLKARLPLFFVILSCFSHGTSNICFSVVALPSGMFVSM